MLGIKVQALKDGIRLIVDVELARARVGTGAAALAPLLAGGAVEASLAEGVHGLRLGFDAPVHHVEVMGGLVHQETARVLFPAVPAPEVVGPVLRIQKPLKVHVQHPTDDALTQ